MMNPVSNTKEVQIHQNDLPADLSLHGDLAVDCETMGLHITRDRLCLVQICDAQGATHLVQFAEGIYDAPNLSALLRDTERVKIMHFARFDLAAIQHHLGVMMEPVFCTKIASKLTRTYTERHSLKNLVQELLSKELSKAEQCSDWGASKLTDAQHTYAAQDVIHLHACRDLLAQRLKREKRDQIASACFSFLQARVYLDLMGWDNEDIFAHGS